MKNFLLSSRMFILFLFISIAVSGCGGSSGGSTNTGGTTDGDTTGDTPETPVGTTITGTVTAPGGTIAQIESSSSYYYLAMNFLVRPSYADILGLLPVTTGTAELIEINDDGNQVGNVIASAPLTITGTYSLEVPAGRALAANLVVRITSGSVSMRAMVVDQEVDINPISEYVLQKFVDDDTLTLADVPVGQVIALTGRVREFDLTAEADLGGMLAKLEADLGELVELEIEEIESTPADSTVTSSAVGNWNTVEYGLSLHDNEENSFGTFNMSVFSSNISVTADSTTSGEVDIAEGNILIDSWSNLSFDGSGVFNVMNELVLDDIGDGIEFSGGLDANGNLVVETPFEEDLQTGDCPSYGWRWPPNKQFVDNTGNDNALVNVTLDAGVRYRTVDPTGANCPSAIDPEQKDGDETEARLLLVLKAGDIMNNASLNGDYGFVSLRTEISSSGGGIFATSTVGQANFDGQGVATVSASGLDEVGFERFPGSPGQAFISPVSGVTQGPLPIEYSVSTNGMLTLQTETILEGWVNEDASLFGLLDLNVNGGDFTSSVDQELLVGIRLPSSAPSLDGTVYRLSPLLLGMGENGYSEVAIFGRNNSLTFGATSATFTGKTRGYERGSDTGPITSFTDDNNIQFGMDGPGTNGKIVLTEDGGTITATGFVSEDGSVLLMRVTDSSLDGDKTVGIIIGIRQ